MLLEFIAIESSYLNGCYPNKDKAMSYFTISEQELDEFYQAQTQASEALEDLINSLEQYRGNSDFLKFKKSKLNEYRTILRNESEFIIPEANNDIITKNGASIKTLCLKLANYLSDVDTKNLVPLVYYSEK